MAEQKNKLDAPWTLFQNNLQLKKYSPAFAIRQHQRTGTQRANWEKWEQFIKLKYLMRPTLSNAESALAEAELDSEEGGAAATSSSDDVL